MAVTFTRLRQTHDPTTGRVIPTTTTLSGNAVRVRGRAQRYEALGLNLSTMPTVLFTPTSYNLRSDTDDFVAPGDKCEWNDEDYTVKDVDPIAPDGFVIAARVVIGK